MPVPESSPFRKHARPWPWTASPTSLIRALSLFSGLAERHRSCRARGQCGQSGEWEAGRDTRRPLQQCPLERSVLLEACGPVFSSEQGRLRIPEARGEVAEKNRLCTQKHARGARRSPGWNVRFAGRARRGGC